MTRAIVAASVLCTALSWPIDGLPGIALALLGVSLAVVAFRRLKTGA